MYQFTLEECDSGNFTCVWAIRPYGKNFVKENGKCLCQLTPGLSKQQLFPPVVSEQDVGPSEGHPDASLLNKLLEDTRGWARVSPTSELRKNVDDNILAILLYSWRRRPI